VIPQIVLRRLILSYPENSTLLVFGAHPDDIEFGCGGIVSGEAHAGLLVNLVVCSLGEAGSYGTSAQREEEARAAASALGAQIQFIELDGDSHLEMKAVHAIKLAQIIRRLRPVAVLAPTVVETQHPDHYRLGRLVRDAARLARYGGLKELSGDKPHMIEQLFFYAVTPEGEPANMATLYIDISAPEVVSAWTTAMNMHASQTSARKYVDLQLTRAKLFGARAGVEYAMALYSEDALLFSSLGAIGKGVRQF
jgi:LmbE family N-acetylglucosaminyl deacetylase